MCVCGVYVCMCVYVTAVEECDHTYTYPTGSSWVSTEPEGSAHRPHIKGESGFGSAESEQFLEYLRNVHSFQVQVLCVRVSKLVFIYSVHPGTYMYYYKTTHS